MMKISEMPKYEVYKDSGVDWIGKIPEHWNLKSLKRVVKEHSGNGFPIELQGQAGDIPFLKVSDLSCEGILVDKSSNRVSHKVVQKQKWNIVPAGSLVTAKIGEALRKNHRKLLAYDSIIDNNCIAFECVKIEKKYNFYLHLVIDFDWFVNPGAVPSISVSKYKSQKVVVPSMKEQVLIANFLDKKTALIDEAIAIKEQQISLLKERKQIIIQQAVTQGLDPNVPMKDSGVDWIGKIPAHWEVKRLKYVTKILKRIIGYEGPDVLSITQKGIKVKDIESGEGQLAMDYSKYQIVRVGDFAMNHMDLLTGYVDISQFEGVVSPDYRVFINTYNGLRDDFLLSIFQLGYQQKIFYRYGQGVSLLGRWRFPADNFNNFFIPVPPIEEQAEIVQSVQREWLKLDNAIELLISQIEKLKEYKTTLINSAVTGKIKITPEMVEQ